MFGCKLFYAMTLVSWPGVLIRPTLERAEFQQPRTPMKDLVRDSFCRFSCYRSLVVGTHRRCPASRSAPPHSCFCGDQSMVTTCRPEKRSRIVLIARLQLFADSTMLPCCRGKLWAEQNQIRFLHRGVSLASLLVAHHQ